MPGNKCPICGDTGAQHIPLSDYFCVSAGYEREKARAETMRKALTALLHEVEESGNGDARDFGWGHALKLTRAALAAPASAPGEET